MNIKIFTIEVLQDVPIVKVIITIFYKVTENREPLIPEIFC